MSRTGDEYREHLRDGRSVWIDGERVEDVTAHPAFANSVASIARLYDMQHDAAHREILTYETEDGGVALRAFQIPKSHEDLVARRQAMKLWAEATFGFMGRTPDYKASMWAGFAAMPHVFAADDGHDYPSRVVAQWERLRDNDVFQSHTLLNPQIDRTKPASEQEEPFLYLGVVDERDDGIIVRGAKMLGTGAALSDEIQIGVIEPLAKHDADYALTMSVPLATKGVRILCRRSYSAAASSIFDYPLSRSFDENDAIIAYDDVFVPWEQVFVYRDPSRAYRQWYDTPAFCYMITHGAIRFWTKLEFLVGLAIKIAKANNSYKVPPVRMTLGRLLAAVHAVRALVLGAEANFEIADPETGVVQPNRAMTFSYRALAPQIYVDVLSQIKDLCGGGVIQLPGSYRDLLNDEEAPFLRRYIRSPGHDADRRIQLLKLAWDALGSEFGGRHEQYERFYLGASYAYLPVLLTEGQPEVCEALVDAALESYSLQDALREADGELVELTPPRDDRVSRVGALEGPGLVSDARRTTPLADRELPIWR